MEDEDLELERLIKIAEEEKEASENDEEESGTEDEDIHEEESEEDSDEDGSESEESDEDSGDDEDEDEEESSDDIDDDDDDDTTDNDDTGSFEPVTLDVNGVEVTVDNISDLVAYARKGASEANKTETHVEEKLIIDQGKLSQDDLKLLVDAKNGSKEAIAKLAEMAKVDTMEIEEDSAKDYRPQFKATEVSEVDKVANEIAQDAGLKESFQNVSKALPQDFTNKLMSDAGMLKDFARHVKDGIAQEIIPQAITAQMRDGGSFMDAYTKVGQALTAERQKPAVVKEERQVSDKAQKLRDKATSNKSLKKTKTTGGKDIWDLSQEDFEKKLSAGEIDLS